MSTLSSAHDVPLRKNIVYLCVTAEVQGERDGGGSVMAFEEWLLPTEIEQRSGKLAAKRKCSHLGEPELL